MLSRRIERASVHERRAIRAEEKPDNKTATGGIIGVIAPRRAAQRSKSATRILQPKVHLNCVEFTLKYRDGVRKVVDNLGTGLVNVQMALLRRTTTAMTNFRDISDTYTRLGNLTSDLTRAAAASAGLRDAPISRG